LFQSENRHSLPTVSIGLPVYNGEKYIREALDSVLTQTFADFELIISDNASEDDTESICREYASRDERVRYIRQSRNIGALPNFLFVLHKATAEYFMWAAHDDVVQGNDFLFRLVTLIKDNRLDLVFPNVDVISSKDGSHFTVTRKGVMDLFSACKNRLDYCAASIIRCNHQLYGLYRKSALIESARFLEKTASLRVYGDLLFIQAFSARYTMFSASDVIRHYRRHANNLGIQPWPPQHFSSYLICTVACVNFWLFESPLPMVDRVKVLFVLVRVHGPYGARLMVSSIVSLLQRQAARIPGARTAMRRVRGIMSH
jgi:glycosyltransferase involved in cell wall biosynthesis